MLDQASAKETCML